MQVHVCAVSMHVFRFGAFQALTWLVSAMSQSPFTCSSGEAWAVACNGRLLLLLNVQSFISRGKAKESWTPWTPLNEKLSASFMD